jgi:hypothetical protein
MYLGYNAAPIIAPIETHHIPHPDILRSPYLRIGTRSLAKDQGVLILHQFQAISTS